MDDLVCELVGTINALRSDGTLFKCILWPMFIAGLESRQMSQRRFLIGCLERFWLETKCLNVVNAADILQKIWDQGGSSPQWIFNTSQLGHDWLLI
ncbi:C6 transcription factor Acr-2 [Aspergillus sp. HF37]|nr:C6 transcription factor Acr-2 [Aspergillus sp. HF37]